MAEKVMKKVLVVVLIWVGFLIQAVSLAQQPDTIVVPTPVKVKIDSTQVRYFSGSFDSLTLGHLHYVDTNLLFVTRFDPLSNATVLYQTLSNAGLAHQALQFKPIFLEGFDMNRHPYERYVRNGKQIKYLDPTAALTEISYMMGSKKEQQLKVLFARQLAPRLYIGMDFELIDSKGPYKNNGTSNTSVYFTGRYNTKNQRYGVIANYFNNKVSVSENGGIVNDSVFENNLETDRRVIGVNLEDATGKYKQSGFGFEQYFILLPENKQKNDSVTEKRRFQLGRITHQFDYQRNQYIYQEKSPMADFYKPFDIVLDSSLTYDSTYHEVIRNRFFWSSLGYKKYSRDVPFHLYAGVELLSGKESDSMTSKSLWQINPFGGINISVLKSFYVNGTAKLIGGNSASGDFELFGQLRQFLGTEEKNLGNLFFSIRLINQRPSWFFQRYNSNHFRWESAMDKSTYLTIDAGYKIKTLEAGASWNVINNYAYLNKHARPFQTNKTISVLRIYGNFHFRPGKFDILANVNYQVSDHDTIISLPALSAKLRLAFTQQLFKNAATLQPGIEASWFSEYYADAYMPAIQAFYLQREKKTGNYPYVDIYLALKVKRARIFVQYANLFGLTGNYTYFTTPHYPMRDPRFYFGVSWRFYQ